MDLMRTKGLGTAEDLGHIETSLQAVEYQNEFMYARFGQQITAPVLLITAQHLFMAFKSRLSG